MKYRQVKFRRLMNKAHSRQNIRAKHMPGYEKQVLSLFPLVITTKRTQGFFVKNKATINATTITLNTNTTTPTPPDYVPQVLINRLFSCDSPSPGEFTYTRHPAANIASTATATIFHQKTKRLTEATISTKILYSLAILSHRNRYHCHSRRRSPSDVCPPADWHRTGLQTHAERESYRPSPPPWRWPYRTLREPYAPRRRRWGRRGGAGGAYSCRAVVV